MARPKKQETILKDLLKLSPAERRALLKRANSAGKDMKKLRARRKELVRNIRKLEKELAKVDAQMGGGSGGRGAPGRKRGPRSPEATRQARLTRYTNSVPKLKAAIEKAKGAAKEKLQARLAKAERILKELGGKGR